MDEFYTELKKLVPLKYDKGDFRDVLVGALESYVDLLELHKKELCPDIDDVIIYVKSCNIKIETCIEAYFEGMYSVAYQCIEEILSDVLYSDGYLTILPDSLFYRARVFKTNGRKSYTEMFHIPLDKRGIVETQRYSAPGYPCLYLGSSINACWEELRKPRFDDMMVSLFVVNEKFPVLDLRIPKKEDLKDSRLSMVLKKIPLILSSSVYVLNRDSFFKPEYIIPQLIIEYIITQNRNRYKDKEYDLFEFILGVYYTSVHINDDWEFPCSTFDNLALPVVFVNEKENYCQLLASCFKWTDPTSYSYEDIRGKFDIQKTEIDKDVHLTEKEKNYKYSKMGKLERRLFELERYQMAYLVVNKRALSFSNEGEEKKIGIRSSSPWIIT